MSMIEVAKTQLAPEDHVVKSYRALKDHKDGFLVFSNHKLMFVAEEGMFRKKYRVSREVNYNSIKQISVQASHRLKITEDSGLTHEFTSFGSVTAERIKDDTHELIAREK